MKYPDSANHGCEVHIFGVGTLDKTGVKNVDMNGNGTADSEDSLAILKARLDIED